MRLVISVLSAFAFHGLASSASPALAAEPPRSMALTFDDLPYAAASHDDTLLRARRVTEAILAVLEKHQAPATAFVNESRLHVAGEVDARISLLKNWIDAGTLLGNHTFSHADLNGVSVAEFKEEITKGETVTRRLMQSRAPYQLYFRHPYTHTGESEGKKLAIERFLFARGYKVAPHTIDGQDSLFNRLYFRSKKQGNDRTAARVCEAYVDFTVEVTAFAEGISTQIFDRSIPQTLLLHANDINADCLDSLLYRLVSRGYRFVPLDVAMSDPAYETPDTFVTSYGPTWLWRWMKSKNMSISFGGDPEPPEWITELSRQKSQVSEASQ